MLTDAELREDAANGRPPLRLVWDDCVGVAVATLDYGWAWFDGTWCRHWVVIALVGRSVRAQHLRRWSTSTEIRVETTTIADLHDALAIVDHPLDTHESRCARGRIFVGRWLCR